MSENLKRIWKTVKLKILNLAILVGVVTATGAKPSKI